MNLVRSIIAPKWNGDAVPKPFTMDEPLAGGNAIKSLQHLIKIRDNVPPSHPQIIHWSKNSIKKKICREYFYFKRFVINHRRTATYSMSQPVNKHSKHTNAAHICTVVISNLFLFSFNLYCTVYI